MTITRLYEESSQGNMAVDYFHKIFNLSSSTHALELLEGFVPRVIVEINIVLTKPVITEEIQGAVFTIKSCSALGAIGMMGMFYQTYWKVIGQHRDQKIFLRVNHFLINRTS